MIKYPVDFPSDSIKIVVSFIRFGDVPFDVLGLAAWNIQGYAMSQVLGPGVMLLDGNDQIAAKAASRALTNEELADMLEQITAPERAGTVIGFGNWVLIAIALAGLVVNIVKK